MQRREYLFSWIGLVALLAGQNQVMAANAEGRRTTIWGTGVSLTLPTEMMVASMGTNYTNISQDVLIAISVAPFDENVAAFAKAIAQYPDPVEPFQNPSLSGNLYKRTRIESGGSWDGWWLRVKRDGKVLNVRIFYSGHDSKTFPELKNYLSTISWNSKAVDPEVAFGLRLQIPKLQVVRDGAGALFYNTDGRRHFSAQFLLLNAPPTGVGKDISKFHKLCQTMTSVGSLGQSSRIRYAEASGINVCDVWGPANSTGHDYFAAFLLPDGSNAWAKGHGDPDAFQQASLDMQIIARPKF